MDNDEMQEYLLNLSMNNMIDDNIQDDDISIIDRLCKICKTYDRGYLGSDVCKECYWKASKEINQKVDIDNRMNIINHPAHYGGDTTYEHIKVVEAWGLGYNLGNATKYICRASKKSKDSTIEDLKKAVWYINHEIHEMMKLEGRKNEDSHKSI